MIKIAVCDDDKVCLDRTSEMIQRWAKESQVSIEFSSFDDGDALLAKSKACKFDIIFLDIVMPLLNGMDAAREIRATDKTVSIVFLTSSPEFALESYAVKANDYLLKPVIFEKIKGVLDEFTAKLEKEPDSIILKTAYGFQKVYLHEIEFIESQNKQCLLHLTSGKALETAETLYAFENKLLQKPGFFKCHRSYIVSLSNVENYNSTEIKTKRGSRIPIARGSAKVFSEAYFAYMFKE